MNCHHITTGASYLPVSPVLLAPCHRASAEHAPLALRWGGELLIQVAFECG